ncbi:flagellar hook-associated protein FlgK [Cognatilysobacter terrigena]|uniref:flagellar hook-associated protein FlgK n=1 Tax=Cognatilysobacter terrigena TaxID=2488749 RepID=UPI00105F01BD|nr:flagellar hook-associated protein FlgK [Lysobacter terrigena]
MSVLTTGTSALLAFQRALGTVSHNVANVNTEGYSRQRVDLEARPGQNTGAGYVGAGVSIQKLQRLADGLNFARQADSSGELGRLKQLTGYSDRLDGLFSNTSTGLATPWSNFYSAVKGVVSEPGSSIARQAMLDSGDQLAARFRAVDSQLTSMGTESDQRLAAQVDVANQLATEIAKLNQQITTSGANASPDLIDQRDLRIDKLASLTGAQVVAQDDGALNVFSGGQALVLGARAGKLTLAQDPYRADRKVLSMDTPGGPVKLQSGSVSGEIGGLLEFRERVLDPARADLGRMATAFAMSMNTQNRAGVDYTGTAGAGLFSVPAPPVNSSAMNTGTASFTASVTDLSALKGSDVELRFSGGTWGAFRSGTGEPLTMTGTGTAANPLVVEGVSLVVSGAAANGDKFTLRPTSEAAGSIQLIQKDPNRIAAASPLTAKVDPTNLGNAKPGTMSVTDPTQFASFTTAQVDFIDATHYTVDGGAPQLYTPGQPVTGNGWSMKLDGTPGAGDSFSLARTPAKSTDNSNARLLATLDDKTVLDGGTTGMTTGLSRITARVGSASSNAQMNLDAQQVLHDQITAERDSVSGVNLDEEAADMLRYQQAYQAAAQVISTAETMFQTLLGAVRG